MNNYRLLKILKKFFGNSVVISFFTIWLIMGFGTQLRNEEYGSIVKAIEQHKFKDSCAVTIDVRTDWPFGWSANGMSISIEKDGEIVRTSTSKYFKADRVEISPGKFHYLYRWSENVNNQLLASYLELELENNRGNVLKWLKVGNCKIPEGSNYSSYKNKKCESFEQTTIKCT